MTYYGVWSGKEWWNVGNGVFHTTTLGLALAQAIVVNAMWDRTMRASSRRDEHWEARAIGEDGLPTDVPTMPPKEVLTEFGLAIGRSARKYKDERDAKAALSPTEEQKRIRSETASHKCVLCGKPALAWTFAYVKGWMCEQHSHVSVGCLSAKEEP